MPNFIITQNKDGEYGLEEIEPDTSPGSLWSFFLSFFLGRDDPRKHPKERVDYYEYIQSPEWKERAKVVKARAHWRCEKCGVKGDMYSLQAHHLTYERLGHERLSDLMCLCDSCHSKIGGVK